MAEIFSAKRRLLRHAAGDHADQLCVVFDCRIYAAGPPREDDASGFCTEREKTEESRRASAARQDPRIAPSATELPENLTAEQGHRLALDRNDMLDNRGRAASGSGSAPDNAPLQRTARSSSQSDAFPARLRPRFPDPYAAGSGWPESSAHISIPAMLLGSPNLTFSADMVRSIPPNS